jgi:hypothetical protein
MNTKPIKSILMKAALITTVFTVGLASLTVAKALFAKREFRGKAQLLFCKRSSTGQWEVFDKWSIPNLSFNLSAADVALGKEFTTTDVWEGRTEKGKRIRTRLSGAGKAKVTTAGNLVDLVVEVPFEITVEDKTFQQSFQATTGTAQGASGTLSGKRAILDSSDKSITTILVGSREVQVPTEIVKGGAGQQNIKEILQEKTEVAKDKGGKTGSSQNGASKTSATERILVVGTVDGKLKAVN